MRTTLSIALLALATTGCATTGKTRAERLAELQRYREQKQAEAEGKQPEAQQPAPSGETQPTARTDTATPSTATASATTTPAGATTTAPAAPALPVGPRPGLFGLRATLLGNGLALGESAGTSSTLGLRYFFSESFGINLNVGVAHASVGDLSATGLSLGLGLNVYGGTPGKALRPYFALEGTLNQVAAGNTSATVTTVAAGGGLEYWLAPQLSVNTTLLFGLATAANTKGVVLGTFQPGLGVTLYTE